MSEMQVERNFDWLKAPKSKDDKPKKGEKIRLVDERYGMNMTAVVDDISEDGTRMTLSRIEEDE